MMTRQSLLRLVLYALLFATLGASGYYNYQDSMSRHSNEVVDTANRPSIAVIDDNPTQKVVYSAVTANARVSQEKQVSIVDIFEVYKTAEENTKKIAVIPVKTVIQPSPPVVTFALSTPIPAAPVTPVAPVIPFKYIGKILGDDEYSVFVALNGKNYVVKEGDVVQQTYKIEKITPPVMTVTYIPMNVLQTMQIGASN